MNPWFLQLSRELPTLRTRAELTAALEQIEDHYDHFNEVEQETADQLIELLNRRIASASEGSD